MRSKWLNIIVLGLLVFVLSCDDGSTSSNEDASVDVSSDVVDVSDAAIDVGIDAASVPCGDTTCAPPMQCCNPLQGACVMPGMVCLQ
ncbi:MAG: hypothetical protein IPJ88_03155 [Myxococcales bacterium]|nr:MAG: hypothetical protein IPJ88_03155 [Myxococcales bacterium]